MGQKGIYSFIVPKSTPIRAYYAMKPVFSAYFLGFVAENLLE
jgi:hypothetical protein